MWLQECKSETWARVEEGCNSMRAALPPIPPYPHQIHCCCCSTGHLALAGTHGPYMARCYRPSARFLALRASLTNSL